MTVASFDEPFSVFCLVCASFSDGGGGGGLMLVVSFAIAKNGFDAETLFVTTPLLVAAWNAAGRNKLGFGVVVDVASMLEVAAAAAEEPRPDCNVDGRNMIDDF